MPELPEVESLRRGLTRLVVGQKIVRVQVRKPKLVSGKGNIRTASDAKRRTFIRGLTNETLAAVDRRAKNLIFRFSSGKMMLVHLKMSGQFVYRERGENKVIGGHPIELAEHELPNKHTHLIFELERGTLYYNDTRMFGYLLYYPSAAAFEKEEHFADLGLEPLDAAFTPAYLAEALQSKKGRLKTVLMDQKIVTGLGNIYADEAMFEAGVRPTRSAASLTREEIKKLHAAIRRILKRAIDLGGSSVATYRLVDDSRGNYAREHNVYGKAGKQCVICGGPAQENNHQ
jgi:formamidopyrimidine-DNA glycosylase